MFTMMSMEDGVKNQREKTNRKICALLIKEVSFTEIVTTMSMKDGAENRSEALPENNSKLLTYFIKINYL